MKTKLLTILFLILGMISFDQLFWLEELSANLFLFSILIICYSLYSSTDWIIKKEIYLSLTLLILSGCMVLWHHTALSIFMLFLTTCISLGLIKQNRLVHAFEGLAGFFASYLMSPFLWINRIGEKSKGSRKFRLVYKSTKLIVIPIILFVLFFSIYRGANPKFEELTHSLVVWISSLFVDISFGKALFLAFGFSLVSFSLYRFGSMMEPMIDHSELLKRVDRNKKSELLFSDNLFSSLVNEYKIGLLVFGLLNALLFIVNVLDINWIWFDFEVPLDFNLKQFVHEGTYLLIFSILLSIVIFLYFFRNSLNFYPKNTWLKRLGIVWVIQNMVLVCSVLLRNYHYIDYHGLASKRIGVLAFLFFTFFGLITLIIKVQKLKTFSYLIRINSWFILISLSLMCCFHWDRVIVHHNLAHTNPGEIDVDYYLKLSPTVAPIIFRNLSKVEEQMAAHVNRDGKDIWLQYIDIISFEEQLEYQTAKYLSAIDTLGWPSWNYVNHKLMKETKLIPLSPADSNAD